MLKEAIQRMLKDGEFYKVIKHAKGRDKQNAKEFYEAVKDLDEEHFAKVPEIVFIQACKSWNVWQDLYIYMELIVNEKQNAEKA